MKSGNRSRASDGVNPYIALTDMLINLVFILLFFAAAILFLGRLGQGDIQYQAAQNELKAALEKAFPLSKATSTSKAKRAVWNDRGRNDPPGTQRWVLDGQSLFIEGTSDLRVAQKGTEDGATIILKFAKELRDHRNTWRRIRIEGHTEPPAAGALDDWDLSAKRAAVVARLLSGGGRIASYYLSVSARAGQNPIIPIDQINSTNYKTNERVEFVIEYAKISAAQR